MPDTFLIAQAIEFIEANLVENITVADMADAVNFSLFHFCRCFNQATHHTPYNYLMRRRLSESALELVRSDKKLIDIALDLQFNNPETFSRAFKRMFGVQPSQIRQQGFIDPRRLMPTLIHSNLQFIEENTCLTPQLVNVDSLNITGIMTLVKNDPSAIPEIWELYSKFELVPKPAFYYGITWYPDDWFNRGFLYLAGTEAEVTATPGSPWIQKNFIKQDFAVFNFNGSHQSFNLLKDYINHTWLPRSGCIQALPFVIDKSPQVIPSGSNDDFTAELWAPIEFEQRASLT